MRGGKFDCEKLLDIWWCIGPPPDVDDGTENLGFDMRSENRKSPPVPVEVKSENPPAAELDIEAAICAAVFNRLSGSIVVVAAEDFPGFPPPGLRLNTSLL